MPKKSAKKFLQVTLLVMLLMIGIAQAQTVTLTLISPSSGQAGVTNIGLTGNGFPSGEPSSAANVTITLTPVGGGTPLNITPLSVVTIGGGGIRRMMFQLPAGSAPASPTAYNVSLSDPTDGLSSGNTLSFTENPNASISSLSPNNGTQGAASVPVTITGSFTNFLQGSTQANFGSGITVNSLTVNSATSATANITIASGATTGARTITVSSGVQSETASFTVNAAVSNFTVSGQVTLLGPVGAPVQSPAVGLQGVTVSLGGGLTGTTDVNGNYSISNVPAASYTVTPSFTVPAGDSVVFYPATQSLTVSGNVSGENFSAQPGYAVTGTVSYSGRQSHAWQAYVKLQLPNCANCPTQGTSVELTSLGATTVTKAFTIHGVPPGTYTLQAYYNVGGFGARNINDPVASPVTVTVSNANVSAGTILLVDPATLGNVSPGTPDTPLVFTVSPIDNGVVIYYPSVLINGVEQALGYNVNWSASAIGGSPTDCQSPNPTFGGGLNVTKNSTLWEDTGNVVFLDGNNDSNPFFTLSPSSSKPAHGQTWYFCMQGVDGHGNGGTWYTAAGGSNTYAAVTLAAAPTSSGAGTSTVGVNVTIPAFTPYTGNTLSLQGPLYTGCYDRGTHLFNVASVPNSTLTGADGQPGTTTTVNVFSVPNGTNCTPFAGVDNDSDGLLTPDDPFAATTSVGYAALGDLFNFGRSSGAVSISGATTQSVDLTNDSENSVAALSTQSFAAYTDQNSVAQPQNYAVNFSVSPLVALPGTVQLQTPSPKVNSLMDFAAGKYDFFTLSLSTGTVAPQVGDSYNLLATPLDNNLTPDMWGSASSTCTNSPCPLQVSGVNTSFPTGLSASGGGTPTFNWGTSSGLTYQFTITDTNGNVIWQVSNLPSSTTSLTWSTGAGAPTPTLASGTYLWSVSSIDGNSNLATQKQVYSF